MLWVLHQFYYIYICIVGVDVLGDPFPRKCYLVIGTDSRGRLSLQCCTFFGYVGAIIGRLRLKKWGVEDVAPYNEKYYVFVGADSISARLFLSHCTPHPSAFGCHLLPLEKAWDRVDIESTPTEKEYIRSVGEGLAPPVFMESNICVVTDCRGSTAVRSRSRSNIALAPLRYACPYK